MLCRAERRARKRALRQVELVTADMTALPFADGEADLFLSYSGHPVPPRREEVARWLASSGLEDATIGPQPGLAAFSAQKGPVAA